MRLLLYHYLLLFNIIKPKPITCTNPLLPSYLLCISDVIYVMDDYPSINVLLMMLLPLLTSKQRMPKWQSPMKPIPYNQYVM